MCPKLLDISVSISSGANQSWAQGILPWEKKVSWANGLLLEDPGLEEGFPLGSPFSMHTK